MLELADGMILYHGSYCKVAKPELEKCAKRKDFGRGFYLTSSKEDFYFKSSCEWKNRNRSDMGICVKI